METQRHRKTVSIGTTQQATHTSSMKSIESSMVALSVSLSSYLTKGCPEESSEQEPVVKAVVISTKNSRKQPEPPLILVSDPPQGRRKRSRRAKEQLPQQNATLDLSSISHHQEEPPRKSRVHSQRHPSAAVVVQKDRPKRQEQGNLRAEKSMLMQKLEEMAQAITSYKSHKAGPKVSRHEQALRSAKRRPPPSPELQTLLETKYLKSCVEEKSETVVSSEATPRQQTATFKQALGCRSSIEKANTNHCSSVQEKSYPESHQVS